MEIINYSAERIAETLGGKKTSAGWKSRCPAHNDRNPSLSISKGNGGRPLVHCHAGCSQADVIYALKHQNLWIANAGYEKTTEYIYENQDGQPAGKAIRKDSRAGKTFYQLHYENGEWVVGGYKGELKPYRISECPDNHLIFVVEGEKCADVLRENRLFATTTIGGSNRWKPYYAKYFANRDVVILPDNDKAGQGYASDVYRDLKPVAKSVVIVNLPDLLEGEDVYDWLRKEHTTEELLSEVERLKNQPIDTEEKIQFKCRSWPNPLATEAYHGIAGEVVEAIIPKSEADPVAVIVQFLVGFGNLIGRSAHIRVGPSRHYTNIYAVLVGSSSVGRKGTSFEVVAEILTEVDSHWWSNCRLFGLGSGEALVASVRDSDPDNPDESSPKDKRALVTEGEYASILKVASREGNTLSPNLRNGFDSGDLRNITKNVSLKATGAHVSLIAHITKPELDRCLQGSTDIFNGTANRNLWIVTRRSKEVPWPEPLSLEILNDFRWRLQVIAEYAKTVGEMRISNQARTEYESLYSSLAVERPGILGVLTARATPIILRMSCIYALLDKPILSS